MAFKCGDRVMLSDDPSARRYHGLEVLNIGSSYEVFDVTTIFGDQYLKLRTASGITAFLNGNAFVKT